MPTSLASLRTSEDNNEQVRVAQTNVAGCFQLLDAIPVRVTAYHMCFPNTNWSQMFHGLALFLGIDSASNRTRLKFHIGGLTEIKYQLHGYGIPIELIPVTETGRIKIKHLKEWIRLRGILDKQQQEEVEDVCGGDNCDYQQSECERDDAVRVVGERTVTGTPTTTDNANESSAESITSSWPQQMATITTFIVDCPGCKDVLFRSGKTAMIHPGNFMFRSMVEAIFERYAYETRIGKKSIVNELIDAVESIGGRFLVWDKNSNSCWWRKIGASEIRSKVGTFIRNSMSSCSNTRNKQQLLTRESDNTNNDTNNQEQQHVVVQLESSTYAFVKQNEFKRRRCATNVDGNSNNSNNQNECIGNWKENSFYASN